MAPANRSSKRNNPQHKSDIAPTAPDSPDGPAAKPIFIDLMLGTPLIMYVDKAVENHDAIAEMVIKYGGVAANGYSGSTYILVAPTTESGQSLYRQYVNKKGKIILDARWIEECIKVGSVQTFQDNWAGCKVTGDETRAELPANMPESLGHSIAGVQPETGMTDPHNQSDSATLVSTPHMDTDQYPYTSYTPDTLPSSTNHRSLQPATAAPPQSWQSPGGIAPQQTQQIPMMARPPTHPYRAETVWNAGSYPPPPAQPNFDYPRYRDDQHWAAGEGNYYNMPAYGHTYDQGGSGSFMTDVPESNEETLSVPPSTVEKRGRKRTRSEKVPLSLPVAPSSLVANRSNPPARSPSPPSRVIKSTYGGNLFTSEDVNYLKQYIEYCQDQGFALSLREICERVAIKAPHHTFYSWRRYCNKHQIRLGGYSMTSEALDFRDNGEDHPDEDGNAEAGPSNGMRQGNGHMRTRSPTPPRALYRSTTGKGVAFTTEDTTFLTRFMEYRRSQDRLQDMVTFWKDVATKAPHHSRASWMKYWRRHKHELQPSETDAPLPQAPEKKLRYSSDDDILLAKHFLTRPEGTSDMIFQAFGRQYPHHPWKGWQEHHRIHKVKIDHLLQRLENGESIDTGIQTIAMSHELGEPSHMMQG